MHYFAFPSAVKNVALIYCADVRCDLMFIFAQVLALAFGPS